MSFPGIDALPWLLVLVGTLILLVVLALYWRSRQIFSLIDQLYALNSAHQQDLLQLLDNLYPLLHQAHACAGVHYRLNWYGQPVEAEAGRSTKHVSRIEAQSAEADVCVMLYWHHKPMGERWIANEVVMRTIGSLVRMNLMIKEQAQVQAQLQASRNLLFLRHDIKNLAQFIHLQQGLLSRLEPGDDKGLKRAVRAAELARTQSDEVLLRLQQHHHDDQLLPASVIDIASFCRHKADAFGMKITLAGAGQTRLPTSVLDTVLENIFANAVQHAGVDCLELIIAAEPQGVVLAIRQQVPISTVHLSRVFEPLASQSDEPGRGVGMYHCRTLLRRYEGEIEVSSTAEQACFRLHLPMLEEIAEAPDVLEP